MGEFYLTAEQRARFFYSYQLSKALQTVSRNSLVKYTGMKHTTKSLNKLPKRIIRDICTYKTLTVTIYVFARNWRWYPYSYYHHVAFST